MYKMLRVCTLHFNPLNAELNPICHLLTLLGGATIVVVSRLRVKIVVILDKGHFRAEICRNFNVMKNILIGNIVRRRAFVGLFHFINN